MRIAPGPCPRAVTRMRRQGTTMADKPRHLPYEEEAQLMTDVLEFFVHKLPHAIEEAAEQLDEATLANTLFEQLSELGDEELAKLGLHREDIAKAASAAAGLFGVAHRIANSGNKKNQ